MSNSESFPSPLDHCPLSLEDQTETAHNHLRLLDISIISRCPPALAALPSGNPAESCGITPECKPGRGAAKLNPPINISSIISRLLWKSRLWLLLMTWKRRWRQRRELANLDQRHIQDIGICQIDALRESHKPFWRK